MQRQVDEREGRQLVRSIAEAAFARAAGAPLIRGNRVRLLKDARENYPAWLEAIHNAKRRIHFECYIIHEDSVGEEFSDALIARAAQGVRVRVAYDWMGGFGKASRRFWNLLRTGGVEVRCYNPPRLDSPLGWLSRDHRKCLVVDGKIGFIAGLCVGTAWVGDPSKKIDPWRDTGVESGGMRLRISTRHSHTYGQRWDRPCRRQNSPERRWTILAQQAFELSRPSR
jgi:cardiolipin synthase A/B